MGVFRKKLKDATELVSFDDITLLPNWSEVEPSNIDVASKISENIEVTVPFVSSPMEWVTGTNLAIALARVGGIGILHRKCTSNEQVEMVKKVKKTPIDLTRWPNATIDEKQSLRVGAAIGPQDIDRVKALGKVIDVIVVDVAHFHTRSCFSGARSILKESPVDVIVGNIGTFSAAEDVLSQLDGVAGIRCGFGGGITHNTSVHSRDHPPTLFAIASAADAARTLGVNIPIIADGDIQRSRDMTLALAVGAWTVMLESVLAPTKESLAPSEVRDGKLSKAIGERLVPITGTVQDVVDEFCAGIQNACAFIGASSIPEMWESARFGRLNKRRE